MAPSIGCAHRGSTQRPSCRHAELAPAWPLADHPHDGIARQQALLPARHDGPGDGAQVPEGSGYPHEAMAWRDWLLRAVARAPEELQIVYGLAGERRLTDWEANWLPGHNGSAPVRVGNAAVCQFRLDVYGEAAEAPYALVCRNGFAEGQPTSSAACCRSSNRLGASLTRESGKSAAPSATSPTRS